MPLEWNIQACYPVSLLCQWKNSHIWLSYIPGSGFIGLLFIFIISLYFQAEVNNSISSVLRLSFSVLFYSFPRICKYLKRTLQSHQLLLPWASTSWMELTSLLLPFFLFFYSATEASYLALLHTWVSVRLSNFPRFSCRNVLHFYCKGSSFLILYYFFQIFLNFKTLYSYQMLFLGLALLDRMT